MIEITHGRVLRTAGPIVLSNATVPLLGAVDTAVIEQLGDPASLGAVGLGAVILATLYRAFGFLRMSTSGLAAQAVGARSERQTRAAGQICMQWGIGGAVGLALVVAVTGPMVIDLLTTSPEVRAEARAFLPWLVAAPLIGVAAWIYDGIFIGAMLTGDMLRAMLVLNAVRTLTLWRLYPKVPALVAQA